MIRKFHHVGIAVKDLQKAIAFFEKSYGTKLIWRATYEDQECETALVANGKLRFELLAGIGPDSFIAQFIKKRGEGIHHISLQVDRFEEVIADFKAKGLKVMVAEDTEDFKAAFIHPQGNSGVLTEIIAPKGVWGSSG